MKKNIGVLAALLIGIFVIALAIRAGYQHGKCDSCQLAVQGHIGNP